MFWQICVLALLSISIGRAQDLNVYGLFVMYNVPLDARNVQNVYAKCFEGMGFESCLPVIPTDVISYESLLPYYRELASYYGQPYCLQCCGESIDYVDTWDLYCDLDDTTKSKANLYGMELRLARNRYDGDTGIISCPLRRSACTYSSEGKTLGCDRSTDHTFLVGYTLTIEVEQYSGSFRYWRGASRCSIESYESNWPLNATNQFHETIIMKHVPAVLPDYTDETKLLFILLLLYFLAYGGLYALRKKRCCYCQQKLVWSFNMCLKCWFVGAQPPDPVLLKMMEEKGAKLQGGCYFQCSFISRIAQLKGRGVFLRVWLGDMPDLAPGMKSCWSCCSSDKQVHPTSLYLQALGEKSDTGHGDDVSDVQSFADSASIESAGGRKKGKKKWFARKENPNALHLDAKIIGAAVGHPNYHKEDIIYKPSLSP